MQFRTLLSSSILLASAVGAGLSAFGRDQVRLLDDIPIPGSNPLHYCADPKDYLLNVTNVDLSPNPPKPGQTLTINGAGHLRSDVHENAKVNLQVKYGLIRLINQEVSLCDYAAEVDLKCPVKEGDLKIRKEVELPKQIPPGRYTVLANVFQDKEGGSEVITCFETSIQF